MVSAMNILKLTYSIHYLFNHFKKNCLQQPLPSTASASQPHIISDNLMAVAQRISFDVDSLQQSLNNNLNWRNIAHKKLTKNEKEALRKRKARLLESTEKRKQRLQKKAARKFTKRCNETMSEKEQRLQKDATRKSK